MPDVMRQFFVSNITNFRKSKFNRRFSLQDKALALALSKRSLKLYRFLVNIFCLPSIETLRKLVKDINITCGISDCVFRNLEEKVEDFTDDRQKYCILLFDEMKLNGGFFYNQTLDYVEGVVDNGFYRNGNVANHVQVFMLRGIHDEKPWKQPICYTFCKDTSP